jgi:hypothetical protein
MDRVFIYRIHFFEYLRRVSSSIGYTGLHDLAIPGAREGTLAKMTVEERKTTSIRN